MPDYRPNKFGYASGVPSLSEVFDSFDKTAEAANQRRAQEQLQQLRGQQELAQLQEQDRLGQEAQKRNIDQYFSLRDQLTKQGGKGSKYGIDIGPKGDVHIVESDIDPMAAWLRMQQMKDLEDERLRKATQDIEDRSTKAGTSQMLPAMQRLEGVTPGAITGQGTSFKSVGGLKSLVPNVAVSPLEAIGLMPQGAAEERAALSNLSNLKVYDQSGKQINEQEMRRLQDAMGLRGITDPNVISQALNEAGYATFNKQKQVTAGAGGSLGKKALENFKAKGGLAGYSSLEDMLKAERGVSPGGAPAGKTVVRVQRNKKTGQTKTTYSDGSEEIK